MKTISYVLLFVVLMMAACQPKIETKTVDIAAEENAVITTLDNLQKAINTYSINDLSTLLDNKGLYLGTDPKEWFDKEALLNILDEPIVYSIDKRIVRVAEDGSTALAVEQFTVSAISEKIPVRCIFHLVKTDKSWRVDFFSWNFIPINEDIAKLNEALK